VYVAKVGDREVSGWKTFRSKGTIFLHTKRKMGRRGRHGFSAYIFNVRKGEAALEGRKRLSSNMRERDGGNMKGRIGEDGDGVFKNRRKRGGGGGCLSSRAQRWRSGKKEADPGAGGQALCLSLIEDTFPRAWANTGEGEM